ncbi:MAG: magnesium transporter [Candidatus Aenigmarchaeota archaeon]|nr:magnesium transporter [Candidatus Aenigmarchaeota archaeon]
MTVANSSWRIVEETLPIIILFSLIELFTGGFLSSIVSEAVNAPGLLIIVPGILGLRGNISSALGARISSGLHLGYISANKFSDALKVNILIGIALSLIMSFLLSIFAWMMCSWTSPVCMSLINFVLISVLTGLLSGVILSFTTASIAILSSRRGLDPDNTTLPSSASIGDVMTIICLLIAVNLVVGLGL